jgi:ferredoxin
MKYTISIYGKKLDELIETNEQIIDTNRQSIITQIVPYSYCSMCGGTGRCGACQG